MHIYIYRGRERRPMTPGVSSQMWLKIVASSQMWLKIVVSSQMWLKNVLRSQLLFGLVALPSRPQDEALSTPLAGDGCERAHILLPLVFFSPLPTSPEDLQREERLSPSHCMISPLSRTCLSSQWAQVRPMTWHQVQAAQQ